MAEAARHRYTAATVVSFYVDMDAEFRLGDLIGMTAQEIEAMSSEDINNYLRLAFDDWRESHLSGGWSLEDEDEESEDDYDGGSLSAYDFGDYEEPTFVPTPQPPPVPPDPRTAAAREFLEEQRRREQEVEARRRQWSERRLSRREELSDE